VPVGAQITLRTKAESLDEVSRVLLTGRVLPLTFFSVADWRTGSDRIIDHIMSTVARPLIVRSSSRREDAGDSLAAGKYLSVLNLSEASEIRSAVEAVVLSYDSDDETDQVLIQPMATNLIASGAASSCDPGNGAPYRIVNWTRGIDTTAVTSGHGTEMQTWYQVSHCPATRSPESFLPAVLELIAELEDLTGDRSIQIEFGVEKEGPPILFQVRHLTQRTPAVPFTEHQEALSAVERLVQGHSATAPGTNVLGKRCLYGVMPDWNPAEIIGIRPRPLALSLYRNLMTDGAWSEGRRRYGYRDVGNTPVLIDFLGLPYIDTRVSFTSLIPAEVDTALAARLVDHYTDCLDVSRHLHDKIEFDVAVTCYTFDLESRLSGLGQAGFDSRERLDLSRALWRLTGDLVCARTAWRQDKLSIQRLKHLRDSRRHDRLTPTSRIRSLLQDCRLHGSVAFAGLARAAFVATQLLSSLINIGIIDATDQHLFLGGLKTVTAQMADDFYNLDRSTFLQLYGHLRPGTYDILSDRYDKAPDLYFDWRARTQPAAREIHSLSGSQRLQLQQVLDAAEFPISADAFMDFLAAAIRAREQAKFELTHNLSDALRELVDLGELVDIDTDALSYLSVPTIMGLSGDREHDSELMHADIGRGRAGYERTKSITLPPIIASSQDIWSFEMALTRPNFVSRRRISAPTASATDRDTQLAGRIVFLPSADPGYDWLFTKGIAGLVTCYGGANSHMSVRAHELDIPAAIGVGVVNFDLWSKAAVLELDPINMSIRVVA
jgi:hypothetical protein